HRPDSPPRAAPCSRAARPSRTPGRLAQPPHTSHCSMRASHSLRVMHPSSTIPCASCAHSARTRARHSATISASAASEHGPFWAPAQPASAIATSHLILLLLYLDDERPHVGAAPSGLDGVDRLVGLP